LENTSIPVLLFMRPKFIRDYFGDIDMMPTVFGFVALATMALQFFARRIKKELRPMSGHPSVDSNVKMTHRADPV